MIFDMHCRLSHLPTNPIPSTCDLRPPLTTRSTLRQQRRRLDDPILIYASNDYATFPPPINEQSNYSARYCDLFNLLERTPTVKYSLPQLSEKKTRSTEDSSSMRRYYRLDDRKANNYANSHCDSSAKRLFRRVARNYFCMPMTANKGESSS